MTTEIPTAINSFIRFGSAEGRALHLEEGLVHLRVKRQEPGVRVHLPDPPCVAGDPLPTPQGREPDELTNDQAGAGMPIRPDLRHLYPAHWTELSRKVRFERAGGICQDCGRPHGQTVRSLPDGRWYDPERRTWRDGRGRNARWPDLEQMIAVRATRVVLAAAHLDHDPTNNRLRNLRSLCQRCHMIHDRPYHLAQRRITYLLRRALGDLFLGQYRVV